MKAWLSVMLFVMIMLAVCIVLTDYAVRMSMLDSRFQELTLSLDTNQGRERLQQSEYDAVVADLPVTRALLEEAAPVAESTGQAVTDLKDERKLLRGEIKTLSASLETLEADNAVLVAERDRLLGICIRQSAAAVTAALEVTP